MFPSLSVHIMCGVENARPVRSQTPEASADPQADRTSNGVNKILSANGKWRIDENGKLVVKEIESEKLKTQSATFGSPEKPEGITIYDEDTREPYCIKIKSGVSVTIAGECMDAK